MPFAEKTQTIKQLEQEQQQGILAGVRIKRTVEGTQRIAEGNAFKVNQQAADYLTNAFERAAR